MNTTNATRPMENALILNHKNHQRETTHARMEACPTFCACPVCAPTPQARAFNEYMSREMSAAAMRFHQQTDTNRENISAWNAYADKHSAPIIATISKSESGTTWYVNAPGRSMGGFPSEFWAREYCKNMGFTVAEPAEKPAA